MELLLFKRIWTRCFSHFPLISKYIRFFVCVWRIQIYCEVSRRPYRNFEKIEFQKINSSTISSMNSDFDKRQTFCTIHPLRFLSDFLSLELYQQLIGFPGNPIINYSCYDSKGSLDYLATNELISNNFTIIVTESRRMLTTKHGKILEEIQKIWKEDQIGI